MTSIELAFGALSIAITVGGGFIALRLLPLEKDIKKNEDEIDVVKKDAHESFNIVRRDFETRMTALHDDSKAERENMERRLSGVERSYASREELAAAINAIGGRFDRGVDRMEAGIKSLGEKVDIMGSRVGAIESYCAIQRAKETA